MRRFGGYLRLGCKTWNREVAYTGRSSCSDPRASLLSSRLPGTLLAMPGEVAWWRPLFLIALMPIGVLSNAEGRCIVCLVYVK